MKSFFIRNKWAFIVSIIVFIIPFLWFKSGQVDYGGDSTRLYFYDPRSWLSNVALYFVNPLNSLGGEMANFLLVPLLVFLSAIKFVLSDYGSFLVSVFNGILLSGGFFFVYLTSQELSRNAFEEDIQKEIVFTSVIAGIFFIFSPLLIYDWERALYSISQVVAYPPIFYLFLKYLNTGKYKYLFFTPFIFFLFSVNFSYATVPCILAFAFFSFIFFLFYSILFKKVKLFVFGFITLLALFILTNSFDIIPQIFSLFSPSGMNYQLVSGKTFLENWGLNYFMSIAGSVHLFYNLLAQSQYSLFSGFGNMHSQEIFDFGINIFPVFLLYPLTITLGVMFVDKFDIKTRRIVILLFSIFLLCLYFITANITNFGFRFYKSLFNISVFSMFRSFYDRFAPPFVFFYALLFSFSLTVLLTRIKRKMVSKIILAVFVIMIIFNGWPLVSGKIVNGILWHTNNIRYSSQIDPDFEKIIDFLKNEKQESKILSLPLASENYQVLQGKNNDGVYFGPSVFSVLAGRSTFSGTGAFPLYWQQIQPLLDSKDYQTVKKYLSLLNIGYIFYNQSGYIVNNFPDYPYFDWFKQTFPNKESINILIDNLGFKKKYPVKDYCLFQSQSNFLPLFYVPRKIIFSSNGSETLPQILSLTGEEQRTGVFFNNLFSSDNSASVDEWRKGLGDYFVFASSNNRDYLALEEKIGKGSVFYPKAKKLFVIQRYFQEISEKYRNWLNRGSIEESLNGRINISNKIISEVISLRGNEEKYLKKYIKNCREEIALLGKIKEKDKLLSFALKIKYNLNDNLNSLFAANTALQIKDISLWDAEINTLLKETKNFLPAISKYEYGYSVTIPKEEKYHIYFKQPSNSFNPDFFVDRISSVEIDGKEINQSLMYDQNRKWIKWGEEYLHKNNSNIRINFKKENLLSEQIWETYVPGENLATKSSILIDNFELPAARKYYYTDISDWDSDSSYNVLVQVDKKVNTKIYLSLGEEYTVSDESSGVNRESSKFGIAKTIVLDTQRPNQEFDLKTGYKRKKMRIFIYGEKDLQISDIGNIFIIRIYEPEIFLIPEISENYDLESSPKITFVKVNPTKYKVKVEKARNPYVLVFSQSFLGGWKVYLGDNLLPYGDIVGSYFNGEIKEGSHKNSFLESTTFETWKKKPIAVDKHLMINGYANSWLITPEDVGNKENYELIVEFWPERLFYFGLLISSVTLFISLLFLLFAFIKRHKK